MSITAIVENGAIKLLIPVPDGTSVEVTLPETSQPGALAERLARFVGAIHSGKGDLADNHDHYLYGKPKIEP